MDKTSALQAWLQQGDRAAALQRWLTTYPVLAPPLPSTWPRIPCFAEQLLIQNCHRVLELLLQKFPHMFRLPSISCQCVSSATLALLHLVPLELNLALIASFDRVSSLQQVSLLLRAGARFEHQTKFTDDTNQFINACCRNWPTFVARGPLGDRRRDCQTEGPFFRWPIYPSVRQLAQGTRKPNRKEIRCTPRFFRLYVVLWVVTERLPETSTVIDFLVLDELLDLLL